MVITPKTMLAITTTGSPSGSVTLNTNVLAPRPGPGQVLIKVYAAAQNPPEWMVISRWITKDVVIGHDFAGIVQEIGEGVTGRRLGERVAGFIQGGVSNEWGGSFAQFCLADAEVLVSLPDNLTFEDAATIGLAGFTAAQLLWQSNKFPSIEEPAKEAFPVLVWGGASAVGQYVIQLSKLIGLQVITTCNPRNNALLLSLGADAVFNYRDPEVVKKIKEYVKSMGMELRHAIDCVSSGDTPKLVGECMGEDGGYAACVLNAPIPREDVQSEFLLVYTLLGRAIQFPFSSPANPQDYQLGIKIAKILSSLLAEGKLKTTPLKIIPGGLMGNVQEWIEFQREGKVSGEKIVYVVEQAE